MFKRHKIIVLSLFVLIFFVSVKSGYSADIGNDEWYKTMLGKSLKGVAKRGMKFWDAEPVITDATSAPDFIAQGKSHIKITGSLDTQQLIKISEAIMKHEDKKQLIKLDISEASGLTVIHRNAFREEVKIGSILLPEGITTIERDAFLFSSNLMEVKLPDSLVQANGNIFHNTSLPVIVLPANTQWTGFRFVSSLVDCTIVFKDGRTKVSVNGFSAGEKVTNASTIFVFPPTLSEITVVDPDSGMLVSEIYSYAQKPPEYKGKAGLIFPNAKTVYVPAGSVNIYKDAWKNLTIAEFKAFPDSYSVIDTWYTPVDLLAAYRDAVKAAE
jgi:hypothetical protein